MTSGADYNILEAKQAKRDGATLVANSGRGQRKGDARTDELLIDYKFTEKASYSLGVKAYQAFKKQAYADGDRQPVVVALYTEHGEEVAMVDWQYLRDLIEERDELLAERNELAWMMEGLQK